MAAQPTVWVSEFLMAIRQIHDCDARPEAQVVQVRLPNKRGKAWTGPVHIFELIGHPKATRCYAWPEAVDAKTVRVWSVLHSDKIRSPEQAVQSVRRRRRRS
jgi:hypothetical protein